MISCNKGEVEIDGNLIELCADLSTIVYGIKSLLKEEMTSEFIDMVVKIAVDEGLNDFSQEEKDEIFDRNVKEFLKALDGIGE